MKHQKWAALVVALGMIAATAGWLTRIEKMHVFGVPGVKVAEDAISEQPRKLAASEGVFLPATIQGFQSQLMPITREELDGLPHDTTFGRRGYWDASNDFKVELTTVLMGTDHTSIHQPEYCLYGQGWNVTNREKIELQMERPYPYTIPAMKLTGTRIFADKAGNASVVNCLYVYWFVSGSKITAQEGSRLWSIASTALQKGEIERWAYISYFAACPPGQETATFVRLQKLIAASVPEFQTVSGGTMGQSEATARN